MSVSTTVRTLLQLNTTASRTDLDAIQELVEAQLLNRLGGVDTVTTVPEELEYIVVNVVLARYNQLGDEGKSSMTVEGESASWLTDLMAPFEDDIQKYLDRTNGTTSGAKIKFL